MSSKLALLALLPLTLASALYPRQNTSCPTSSAYVPTATLLSVDQPVVVSGVGYPQFGQDVYLGIPFAQPPVGDLRFVAPQPKVYNTSTFPAQTQPPSCLQGPGKFIGDYGTSEDCLYLNVFTPEGSSEHNSSLPVFVWVYGGSFVNGAANIYNASLIVARSQQTEKPVIVVAANYRLGIFGFGEGAEFAKNNASNLGLRDVIAGLEWIQQNIVAFGGDPSQVTVVGESAGAILISELYLNSSTNLFRSAIMESGAQATAPLGPTSTTWQSPYDLIVQYLNCSSSNSTSAAANQSSFDCLKAVPAEELLQAQVQTLNLTQYSAGFVFGPSIDGPGGLIPDSPHTLLAQGKFAMVPFISGNNQDEGTIFTPTFINSTADLALVINFVEPRPENNTIIEDLLTLYPDIPALGSPFGTGNQTFGLSPIFKEFAAILGDSQFQSQRRYFLGEANKYGLTETWGYLFNEDTPGAPPYYGSYHGSEVAFIFGSISGSGDASGSESVLSEAMMDYWINFVYYTDPSGGCSNLTYWPKYGSDKTLLQLNGTNFTTIPDTFRQTQMDFFISEPVVFNERR